MPKIFISYRRNDSATSAGRIYDRLEGRFGQAQVMGELYRALDHFEAALDFCRKAGYRPELAWTCCDYADTLLQRDEPGDREKAISLLDESLVISNELGMRPEAINSGGVSVHSASGPYKKKVSHEIGPKVTDSYSSCWENQIPSALSITALALDRKDPVADKLRM